MVASSFHQVSQELVQSPQMWDIPVRLPPLPLGNLSHIQVAGMCAKLQPTFYFAWITKYWQRQGLKAGIHLPTSSSDCTNNLTSELFYFSNYLYWDYSFEDCLCILIADYLMQNVYVVLEAGIGARVSPLPGEWWRQHIRELHSIFQCTDSFHLFSTTLAETTASSDARQQLTASWLRHWPLKFGEPRRATRSFPLFPWRFHHWSSAEVEEGVIYFQGFACNWPWPLHFMQRPEWDLHGSKLGS